MSTSPKKALGQHWLYDLTVLEAIADAADVTAGDRVLEVGPGLGTLTDVLRQRGADVTALEFDQELVPTLRKKFQNCDNVAIIHGDIRTFDLTKLTHPYKIVANIPYYLTSNLIRLISESLNPPTIAALLVQKEVAARICATAGDMSILACTAQFYFNCTLGVFVPAALFTPPPKVDSQVVVLKRRAQKLYPVDEKDFFRLIKAGFSEKRKTLRNSLSSGLHYEKPKVEAMLTSANIKPTARAQELSLDNWFELYSVYKSLDL